MFGIEHFMSTHEGFMGRIKSFPEDFVVTEISEDGKLACVGSRDEDKVCREVGLQKERHSHRPAFDCDIMDQNSIEITEDSIKEEYNESDPHASASCSMPESYQSDTPEEQEKQLCQILGADAMTELQKFAAMELEILQSTYAQEGRAGKVPPDGKNPKPLGADLNLGTFTRKDARTIIHRFVRHLYPHLRTVNHKVPDSGEVEIHISQEPIVLAFQEARVALSRVLDFIRYVEARESERTFTFGSVNSKDQRTCLHRLVAKHYGSFLETKTFGDGQSGEDQDIVVRFRQKFKDRKKRKRGEQHGDDSAVVFTGFSLQKTNIETLDAIQQLSQAVGLHPSDFSYAGIKDKKAVTTQFMCVKGIPASRFQASTEGTRLPAGLQVGDVHPRNGPIHLGQLWGNHFDITLRDVQVQKGLPGVEGGESLPEEETLLEEAITRSIACVQEKGFINYFGEQRFGASTLDPSKAMTTISPADIGRAMLQEKYAEAVSLILSPDDGPGADQSSPTNQAKRCYQSTGSAKAALKLMPSYKTRECLLLKALNRHGTGNDGCIKALMNIPYKMRQMYIHAFCSLVWNQMASWRIGHHGYQVQDGDLVLQEDSETKVHVVNQKDILAGSFSITDVVLPLPGNSVQFPAHAVGEEYQRRLRDGGLGECNFRLPSLRLNVPGGYRKLVSHLRNLVWGWGGCAASDEGDDAGQGETCGTQTWLPGNHGKRRPNDTPGSIALQSGRGDNNVVCGSCTDSRSAANEPCLHPSLDSKMRTSQKEKTLKLSFDLPASCYATVLLRELMKR
ncbi:pseudouridylate synthase PUS7L-like [Diadema setosum]|uniref:pseudouridylate synthase PUS7L-like n=1 Tax=Diadema setosum TaxID=31175 RepID=UPI003B3AD16C